MEAEELLKKRMTELADKAFQQSMYTHTSFLSLAEQSLYYEMETKLSYAHGKLYSGYGYGERKVLMFGSEALFGYEIEPPIVCLRIEPLAKKFSEPLTHRDYLGAILNLGMERECIGDILVEEDGAYVFCLETMADYIQKEMTRIRHTAVMAKPVMGEELDIQPKFKKIEGFVASFRLDTVISLGFGLSRKESAAYIQGKRVFINGKLTENNGKTLNEGDIISVRGLGKIIFSEIRGQSKKGRFSVVIQKFI